MKILELEYEDKTTGWKLEKTKFDNFNLLVGLSGVGKTKILRAIESLRTISLGKPQNGVKWNVTFTDNDNKEHIWKGEYEELPLYYYRKRDWGYSPDTNEPKVLSEDLYSQGIAIFHRTLETTSFSGNETPKLSPFESVIKLFNADNQIISVANSLKQILKIDSFWGLPFSVDLKFANEVSKDINVLKKRNIAASTKLFLAYKYFPKIFNEIKMNFIQVFPTIKDIRFIKLSEASNKTTETVNVEIKEKSNNKWISFTDISEGMIKTLIYLTQLFLYSKGTLILIDEFENSLGINCIDVVTEILQENHNLQFIITSHHPYIINKISPKYWKIVTRKGSIVTVKDANEKSFARSHHEAFIQLMNLKEYREGIAV